MPWNDTLLPIVRNYAGSAQDLLAFLQSVPDDWRRAGTQEDLVLPVLERFCSFTAKLRTHAGEEAECRHKLELVQWVVDQQPIPVPALGQAWWREMERFARWGDEPTALVVWNRVVDGLSSEEHPLRLKKALEEQLSPVVDAMMRFPTPLDRSRLRDDLDPFQAVKNLVDFEHLVAGGLDPFQTNADQHSGADLLRRRSNYSFRDGWQRDAIVKRLAVLAQALPVERQFDLTVRSAHKWQDVAAGLKTMGPGWLDLRGDDGFNALHTMLWHHPEWIDPLVKRKDVRGRPALWREANAQGDTPLMLPLAQLDTAQLTTWWKNVATLGLRDALPTFERPDQPLKALLAIAVRSLTVDPSLNNDSFWAACVRMGGWTRHEARDALATDGALRDLIDAVVWNPQVLHEPRKVNGEVMAWMGDLTGIDHPWALNYRLWTIADALRDGGAPADVPRQERLLQAGRALLDQGASWAWVTAREQQNMLRIGSTPRWYELKTHWEHLELTREVQAGPTTAARVKARL